MTRRDYDIVIYGATGFVGRQVVEYLAQVAAGTPLRWAIAGRNGGKLAELQQKQGLSSEVSTLVADSQDQPAVDRMVGRGQVVLNTAGPFAKYGDRVVDACVRLRTHYVDITGETPWVRSLIDRYHQRARDEGTRIVPCCGFDSIPSDLGTLLAVRGLQSMCGVDCRAAKTYFRLAGGFNGGTLASAFQLYESHQQNQAEDPFLLNPPEARRADDVQRHRDPRGTAFDPSIDAWVAPFFMGFINTRVVRRSAALWEGQGHGYGPDFEYQEFLKFQSRYGRSKARLASIALRSFRWALANRPARHALRRFLPKPGQGPSEKSMDAGWFRAETVARAADGRQVIQRMRFKGDPGNRATVRLVCESARCLVAESQPASERGGGVLTPAFAFGESLVQRLTGAGFQFQGPMLWQSPAQGLKV